MFHLLDIFSELLSLMALNFHYMCRICSQLFFPKLTLPEDRRDELYI